MNNQFKDLLQKTLYASPFILSQATLENEYSEIFPTLQELGILAETQSDQMARCQTCGQYHKAEKYNDGFILVCEVDPSAGFEEVARSEIIQYKFHYHSLLKWLAESMKLDDELKELEQSKLWYLGSKQMSGRTFKFFFSRNDDMGESQKVQNGLHVENPILLSLVDEIHDKILPNNIVGLFELLDIDDDNLILEEEGLKKCYPKKILSKVGDIQLDKDIVAAQEGNKHFLKLKLNQDGTYKDTIGITPTKYNILNHLYGIRDQQENSKTSRLLASSGISKNPRKITSEVKELNDLAIKYDQKQMVVRLSGYKYQLNPELDCFK